LNISSLPSEITATAGLPYHEEKVVVMSGLLAYFDPGSGSLLLQVLVGGSVGLLVFAKYLWERIFSGTRSVSRPPVDPA